MKVKDKGAEEKVKKMEADIARCWAKYCLNLLISSHQRRLEEGVSQENQESNAAENQDAADDLKHIEVQRSGSYVFRRASI